MRKLKNLNLLLTIFVFVGILFTSLNNAYAAPSISSVSGSFSHGSQVTISGANFGTHANYNNIADNWQGKSYLNFRFKDFEDGSLSTHGFTPGYTDTFSIQSGSRTNSSYYGRGKSTAANRQIQYGATIQGASGTSQTFWSSFWVMLTGTENNTGGKFYRHYLGPDPSRDNFYLATGNQDFYLRGSSESGGATQWTSPSLFTPNQWARIDVLTIASNGSLSVTVWKDGTQQWSHNDWGGSLSYSPNGHTIDVPNMIGFETNTGTLNVDDIFIDFTQARVELGDAPTWSASTHREIQIPTAWSASSITISANQGSFTSGQTAYLYVVDSNGNVNANGYQLTIGGTPPDTTPPAPPTGVVVN